MNFRNHDELSEILTDGHLRQRIKPLVGDPLYLHLSDLLIALKRHSTNDAIQILDYGAGISPYRSLFPKSIYKRADFKIGEESNIDFVLNESMGIDAPSNAFDLILSTQVLEHVNDPQMYLKECMRLLRPGGKLLLSTHGTYPDHPCPLDLYRWTADGLEKLFLDSGFNVLSVLKLTADARALLFLYELFGRTTHRRAFSLLSVLFAVLYRAYVCFRGTIHKWADRFFDFSRVVDKKSNDSTLYIAVLISASKPLS